MSFLNNNNAEFLSARITQKGRNAIAKGNFTINYFQIGDSEFDYNTPFDSFTGLNNKPHQKVFSPFDKESGVKYPYTFDSSTSGTTYGVPMDNSITEPIRNVMGPAGYISDYKEYDPINATGSTIYCPTQLIHSDQLYGQYTIDVLSGQTFQNCEYITVIIGNTFVGTDPYTSVVSGNSTSLVYKIVDIVSDTIHIDRPTPDLSNLDVFNVQVVCNKCENEYPLATSVSPACLPEPIPSGGQLNPWTLNVVWGDKPIGSDTSGVSESLSGYSSNVYTSTKSLLGYTTSTGQTFTDYTGGTLTNPSSYLNSYNEIITVPSEEQRIIAIVHYSELGDIVNDPERFYKYDDYISTNHIEDDSIVNDPDGYPLTDKQYFEVYLPFIYYHRNTSSTIGAKFYMDFNDNYIKSNKNEKHQLLFRYLYDENTNYVGKIFPNNKTIVFDDQEIVAALDYKSNRKYTLPAPKLTLLPSDDISDNSLFTGGTGQTLWITYTFSGGTDKGLNGLPCQYYSKIDSIDIPCQLSLKFNSGEFSNMVTSLSGITNGFVASDFIVLLQLTNKGELPVNDGWKEINLNSQIGGTGFTFNGTNYINPTGLTSNSFIIKQSQYSGASYYDIGNYLNDEPQTEPSTDPQFGDEQPFPGSIRFVRASDIESMRFMVNLPSSQFTTTQNPTYTNGKTKKITEIALLNDNKEVMVIAKTALPITRSGTQVFGIKLDF